MAATERTRTARAAMTLGWVLALGTWPFGLRAQDDRARVKLTAFDCLARPRDLVTVRVKLEHDGFAGLNPDMRGYPLRFASPPGFDRAAATDREGNAEVSLRITRAAPRSFPMTVRFAGTPGHQPAEAIARIFVWPPERRIMVVDVDQTISDLREFDVLLTDNGRIPPLPGAVDALAQLARHYAIVYLSARVDALANKTRAWLRVRGFPEGPLFTRDFRPWESRESFKRVAIARLKERFPHVVLGVGDRADDARAYLGNGLKALIIDPGGAGRFPPDALVLPSWQRVIDLLLPEAAKGPRPPAARDMPAAPALRPRGARANAPLASE